MMVREPEEEMVMREAEETEVVTWEPEEETVMREPDEEAKPTVWEPERAEVVKPPAKDGTVETATVMEPAMMESAGVMHPGVQAERSARDVAPSDEPTAADPYVPTDVPCPAHMPANAALGERAVRPEERAG